MTQTLPVRPAPSTGVPSRDARATFSGAWAVAAEPELTRGMGEAKRRVYRTACVLTALACCLTTTGSILYDRNPLPLVSNLPAVGLCLWAFRVLATVPGVRRTEPYAVGALTGHLLLGDLVNLVGGRIPDGFAVMTSSPVLLLTCVLCCLSMAPRAAVAWMLGVWFTDGALTWLALSRFPWGGAQTAQVSRELVGLGAIALLTLLNRYHSVARQSLATNRDLRALVHTDDLTGLPNRRGVYNHLALRDGELAVAMVDLDHFKRVNDTAGHDRGDEVLRRVAAVLEAETAAEGVAGRWGGEEFVVVMDTPGLGRANLLAERLRARVAAREDLEGVTLSIGVTDQRPGESVTAVLARADELMYEAKHAGRNRVRARA